MTGGFYRSEREFFAQPLSFQLTALAVWFDAVRDQRCEFSPEGARAFQRALEHATEMSADLEREVESRPRVSLPQVTHVAGSNVITFQPRRSAPPRDGGDAA